MLSHPAVLVDIGSGSLVFFLPRKYHLFHSPSSKTNNLICPTASPVLISAEATSRAFPPTRPNSPSPLPQFPRLTDRLTNTLSTLLLISLYSPCTISNSFRTMDRMTLSHSAEQSACEMLCGTDRGAERLSSRCQRDCSCSTAQC